MMVRTIDQDDIGPSDLMTRTAPAKVVRVRLGLLLAAGDGGTPRPSARRASQRRPGPPRPLDLPSESRPLNRKPTSSPPTRPTFASPTSVEYASLAALPRSSASLSILRSPDG